MEEKFQSDIIEGKIIDWNSMSIEEIKELRKKLKQKEKNLLEKLNSDLGNIEEEMEDELDER